MENPDSSPEIRKLLAASPFGNLGTQALDEACAVARLERFKLPTLLSAAGEQPEYLRLVVTGHIEVLARNVSGVEFAVGYVTPGGWATWLACFMENPPDNDFCSSASACFIALPVSEVRSLCARYPQIYPVVIRQIGRRLRLLMEWTGQSVLVDSVQRVAKLLHILAREQQVTAGYAKLNVTQARVATLARCSRQTANEILGVLEQKGLLTLAYGCVEIPDMGRLAAFADAGPNEQ